MPLPSTIHICDPRPPSTTPRHSLPRRTYIIYFLPGNPGLVAFYTTFLTHLYGLLQSRTHTSSPSSPSRPVDFIVHGADLAGFESDRKSADLVAQYGKPPPYRVDEQVEFAVRRVKALVSEVREERGAEGGDVRVVLMGHSLGTYVCLEMMRRLREEVVREKEGVRVVGGVLLFATIMELARSPNGRKASGLLAIPLLPAVVQLVARALLLVPMALLVRLIGLTHGHPPDSARVTATFLKSPHGVEQALYMAHDEMNELSVDKWDDEIWGAAHATTHPHSRPCLRFLFGKQDSWIAQETREQLVKARGGDEEWRPRMEVDETKGWTHDFCIHYSVPVAEAVRGYVDDIVQKTCARASLGASARSRLSNVGQPKLARAEDA